jgi:ribosomal protein L35AE/L33A
VRDKSTNLPDVSLLKIGISSSPKNALFLGDVVIFISKNPHYCKSEIYLIVGLKRISV